MKSLQFLLTSSLVAFMFTSCEVEPEERPVFPSVEYLSPLKIDASQTYTFYGTDLNDSEVIVNGSTLSNVSLNEDNSELTFQLPSNYTAGDIVIKMSDGVVKRFPGGIDANANNNVEGILFTDFDGNGIRPAFSGSDFSAMQWSSEILPFGTIAVANSYNGISASPAGGNFVYLTIPKDNRNNIYWDGEIVSRTELQNDGTTPWPSSIASYPLLPFAFDGEPEDYYVNFYFHSADLGNNQLEITLINNNLLPNEQFKRKLPMTGSNVWRTQSIALSSFKDEYGSGQAPTKENMTDFNGLKFILNRSALSEPALNDGAVLLDHISITKGSLY